jgi:hypothetical protein
VNFNQYIEFQPQKYDIHGEYYRGEHNKIPWHFLFMYLGLSILFCYLYHRKIVAPVDWNAPNSIDAVASFNTSKPYQFRLLIPFLFAFFKPLAATYGKYLFNAYNVLITFLVVTVFYKLFWAYFGNKRILLWLAPVILYTMLWNYILLNGSFQYYDFTAILLATAGLYFIARQNFPMFLFIFIIGLINKETIGYLIFSYALFNYKNIFTRRIIFRTALLIVLFTGYKLLLGYIFRNNPGDPFEIGYYENIRIVKSLVENKTYLRNLLLNFGGLYIFVILLFVTGAWKKFPDRRMIYMNLAIIPYYIFGIVITYITEVRVYTELIPMITSLFLIYLSTFKKTGLIEPGTAEKDIAAG